VTATEHQVEFDSEAAARILARDQRRQERAATATKSEGSTRRPWGTVPRRMDDQLRAALLGQMRELRMSLSQIDDAVRAGNATYVRAKDAEEALLALVTAYEEAINIAADWRVVAKSEDED
jgi:hypothetical protein